MKGVGAEKGLGLGKIKLGRSELKGIWAEGRLGWWQVRNEGVFRLMKSLD